MYTLNIADIIIVLFVMMFGFFGWRKGLMCSGISLLSLAASLVLAWILYPIVSDLLGGMGIRDAVYSSVLDKIGIKADGNLESLMLPDIIGNGIGQSGEKMADTVANSITGFVVNVISFVAVLVLARIIIMIVAKILNVAAKLPVVGGVNRFAGLLLGLAKGTVIACIVLVVLSVTIPVRDGGEIGNALEKSYIAQSLYNKNPIFGIFENNVE